MAKDATFTIEIEPDLREAFMAEAAALDRPGQQIVQELIRDFVSRRREERDYDAWFRAEVEQAIREADDPDTPRIDNDEARASWRRKRAAMAQRS